MKWATDVALVVGRVEVLAVPARGEGNLGPDEVAVIQRKTVGLLICGPDAVVVDGTLRDVALVEGSEVLVTRDHPQARGRRSREVCLIARADCTAGRVIAGAVLVVNGLYNFSNFEFADKLRQFNIHFP